MLIGGVLGWCRRARPTTHMPQLVSLFNAVGGGAAALIAIDDYIHVTGWGRPCRSRPRSFTVLDVVIGSVTFSGSIFAAGKLQGSCPAGPWSSRSPGSSTSCWSRSPGRRLFLFAGT